MSAGAPIFVVGVPRSGTTLLAAILGAHSRMDCGPETHFFAHVRRARLRPILKARSWPEGGLDFLRSIVIDGTPVLDHFGVSMSEARAFLKPRTPSVQALLESLTVVRAGREGKARWIEKTPNHLLHLEHIRSLYPDARIVRIVRDPRDVALSLRRVPFASNSAIANLYSWFERDDRSWRFFETDSGSLTVRYEDLVGEPRGTVGRLCGFLGEGFEEHMLQPQTVARSLIGTAEWWKENVRSPITRSRVHVWRDGMTKEEQRLASLLCAEPLQRYLYPEPVWPALTLTCQPVTSEFIEANELFLLHLAALGVRIAPWDERCGVPDLVVGLPGQFRWSLGATTASRVFRAVASLSRMCENRMRGKTGTWLAEDSHIPVRKGLIDAACDLGVRLTRRANTNGELLELLGLQLATSAAHQGHSQHQPAEPLAR